jgi:diguanylate cyclase (GGDEF)-like protein
MGNQQSQEGNQKNFQLAGLLELSQNSYRLSDKEIIQQALAFAVQATKSEIGFLNLINNGHKTFQFVGWSEIEFPQGEIESGKNYDIDQAGAWAECVRIGKPVINNDFHYSSDKNYLPESFLNLFRHVSVPLQEKDSFRFILSVGNKATDYDSSDIVPISLVGDFLVRVLNARQVEVAYSDAKHQYNQLVKYIPIGIFRVRTTPDDPLTIEYVNQQFCDMVKLTALEVHNDANVVLDRIYADDLPTLVELIREVLKTRKPFLWEGRSVIQGEVKWLQIEARPEAVHKNELIWHGVLTDTTERRQVESAFRDANTLLENRLVEIEILQEQLRDQAIRDYLTGLFNRRYLDETIDRELARAKREASQLSVVMMDIDHFKSINDTYGHQAGDIVLIELGTLLNKYSRTSDIACRHGGDEFMVVMPDASPSDALKRADEWRQKFAEKRFDYGERRFATTLSMGIASYPHHASSAKGVFQAADQALYQSKMHNNKVTVSRRIDTTTLRSIDNT